MVKKKYTKPSEHKKVKQELDDTSPIVVRFYNKDCGACKMSEPAWNQFDMPQYRVIAVEQAAIPPDVLAGISAFPTYAVHDKKGSRHVAGAITSPQEIVTKLEL
jgi:hypothetical protein